MDFLEKDLEEIIFNADRKELSKRGLTIKGRLKRQLRIGSYGVADLVSLEVKRYQNFAESGFDYRLNITVYELKKDRIGISTFAQAMNYVKGIESYLMERYKSVFLDWRVKVVLIGREIQKEGSFIYFPDLLYTKDQEQFLQNYTYSYNELGIYFDQHSLYTLTNEGFGI